MSDISSVMNGLATEQFYEPSRDIDTMSALEIARVMNEADRAVADAVQSALPAIARAIEGICARMREGGRLFYIGAGTSGRLGVLDASECPPTFSLPKGRVIGLIAGGDSALRESSESVEDCAQAGADDLKAHALREQDAVVAISASGHAPYCVGALTYARARGALTVAMSCNANAPFSELADIAIEMPTGPEVLSGSTRLKAGTATKMALNMISTAAMILLGKAYGNMMVDVRATNDKLRERALRITKRATGLDREHAAALLREADGHVKTAIVMHGLGTSREDAERALAQCGGYVRRVLERGAGSGA